MSKLLIQEHPLQVLPSLAVKIGLNEAIVLQQVHYWAIQGKNEIDGTCWVYNSVSEWKHQFPFWSEQTIRRTLANLKERGLLIAKCLNPDPFNRTPYYRIDHETLATVEHSNLEPTNNHGQNETAVATKLVESVDAKLVSTVGSNLVSTSNTETTSETTSESCVAHSSTATTDLFGDVPETAPKMTKSAARVAAGKHTPNKLAATVMPTTETWNAYATAYEGRYGIPPVRNAMINGQLANIVKRIGADEAPGVASWYVSHNSRYYVQQGHSVAALVKDCEKLRTEWATCRQVTATEASQVDRTQTNFNAFAGLIQAAKQSEALAASGVNNA